MKTIDRYILQKNLQQKYYKANTTAENELDNWILSHFKIRDNIEHSFKTAEIEKEISKAAAETITKEIEKIFK